MRDGDAPELNEPIFLELRNKHHNTVVIHTSAYPLHPEATEYILKEAMRAPVGPRSVFLPMLDSSWPEQASEIVQQLSSSIEERNVSPIAVSALHSCFISYSHEDETFVTKLYRSLKSAGVDVWYAPVKMKPGVKLHEEIKKNVRLYDKFLLVLSENSMKSEWVSTELRTAIDEERKAGSRKLIPIRLVSFDKIRQWKVFNAEIGKDIAVELREYFIPDFTHWKVKSRFQRSVTQLLEALSK